MKTFQISTGDDPEKDEVKERKPKTEKKETEDVPLKKPVFDEKTRENFKASVENWAMTLDSETLKKIKEKFDVSPKRAMEIQWFIKCQK